MPWLVHSIVSSLLVLSVTSKSLNSGEECITDLGTAGICVPVRNCSYVLSIMMQPDFSEYDNEYLNTLKCGDTQTNNGRHIPLICCPSFKNDPLCGTQRIVNRIYGGTDTEHGEHPWAALLFYKIRYSSKPVGLCSGTLVSPRYVITAAHCTVDLDLAFARFNEFNRSSTDNCMTTEDDDVICRKDFEIELVTPHPEYNNDGRSHLNDISILRLAENVTYTDYIRPICLPMDTGIQQLPIQDEIFTVTGWGETENGRPSDVQLHVDLPGLDIEACRVVYGEVNVTISDKQLCIGGRNGTDSCKGDSGGPLMRYAQGEWYLIGIVSFGTKHCAVENIPGVYTNVAKYLDWIEMITFVREYW